MHSLSEAKMRLFLNRFLLQSVSIGYCNSHAYEYLYANREYLILMKY